MLYATLNGMTHDATSVNTSTIIEALQGTYSADARYTTIIAGIEVWTRGHFLYL